MSCHASEEALERYSLGASSDEETAQIEEHLLICHNCQDRLAETDLLIKPLRAALAAEVSPVDGPAFGGKRKPLRKFLLWFAPHKLAWMPAFALVLLMAFAWTDFRVASPAPQRVALTVFRGAESDASAQASAEAPIQLSMNLSALGVSPSYRIEIVNSMGAVERSGTLQGQAGDARFDAG
ncbi:MAG: zf-HC2 domain-containing protein, partial [Acidobacteria bacterium]|nr:zf-HC2 domain-containing protein [Acidobacteriota bacterium]